MTHRMTRIRVLLNHRIHADKTIPDTQVERALASIHKTLIALAPEKRFMVLTDTDTELGVTKINFHIGREVK